MFLKNTALLIGWRTEYDQAREKTGKSVMAIATEITTAWNRVAAVVMERSGKGVLIK